MNRTELLTLMDLNWQEMTREIIRATPGGWVVERAGLVMCGSPHGTVVTNMAMVAGPIDARSVREVTDRVFRRAGLPFSVWTRAHADDALEHDLPAVGFHRVWSEPAMALDGGMPVASDEFATETAVLPVADEHGRDAYAQVMAEAYDVYGAPRDSTRAHFATMASVVGPCTQAFLVWRNDRAVAGATLYLSHGVGGIGWVGTLPTEFRRGYGTLVTRAVIRAGLARGARLFNLQASPMGAPVYQRMGFTTPTEYRVFVS